MSVMVVQYHGRPVDRSVWVNQHQQVEYDPTLDKKDRQFDIVLILYSVIFSSSS